MTSELIVPGPGVLFSEEIFPVKPSRSANFSFLESRPGANERCVLIGPDSNWYRVILDESQCKAFCSHCYRLIRLLINYF